MMGKSSVKLIIGDIIAAHCPVSNACRYRKALYPHHRSRREDKLDSRNSKHACQAGPSRSSVPQTMEDDNGGLVRSFGFEDCGVGVR